MRAAITVPVFGRSIPKLLKTALRALAKPIPASTPSTEPSTPMIVASSTIPRRIWPRVAPSVRSMPSSRIRWATVIENVLKIRKLPTSSATPPNTSSTMRKNERSSLMSSRLALGRLRAGLDGQPGRQHPVDPARQLARRHAVGRLDRDAVELALLVGQALRLRQRELRGAGAARGRGAEPLEPDDLVSLHARLAGDAQRVADLEVLAVGGGLVDRGLVGGSRAGGRPCR